MDLPGIEHLLSRLRLQDPTLRRQVAEGLRSGPPPPQALEFLAGMLRSPDRDVRDAAGHGLRESGARGVEVLMRSSRELPDPMGRAMAVRWLGESGVHGCFVVMATYPELRVDPLPILQEALSDSASDVRAAAVTALGNLLRRDDRFREIAATSLRDPDGKVRAAAAAELSIFHTLGPRIEQLLIQQLGNSHPRAQLEAALTLAGSGVENDRIALLLRNALDHEDSQLRCAAARRLQYCKSGAKETVAALTARLSDPVQEVRKQSLETLAGFGVMSAPAIPTILGIIGNRELLSESVGALTKMGNPAIPVLSRLLEDPEEDVRYRVLLGLASHGGNARSVVPGILRCLEDEVARVRYRAFQCLLEVDPAQFPETVSRIRKSSVAQRSTIVSYLAEIGEAALPVFQELAADADPALRELSEKGLARMRKPHP